MKNPTSNQSNQIDYEAISSAVIKVHEQMKEKERADHKKSQINNVRKLLKNYRSFVICTKEAVFTMNKARETLQDMLDDITLLNSEMTIESIYRTKERTFIMVAHIKKIMDIYKIMCTSSEDPRALERYNEVFELFLSDKKKTKSVKQLAAELHKDKSTIYDDISRVCEDIAPLMFGYNSQK